MPRIIRLTAVDSLPFGKIRVPGIEADERETAVLEAVLTDPDGEILASATQSCATVKAGLPKTRAPCGAASTKPRVSVSSNIAAAPPGTVDGATGDRGQEAGGRKRGAGVREPKTGQLKTRNRKLSNRELKTATTA